MPVKKRHHRTSVGTLIVTQTAVVDCQDTNSLIVYTTGGGVTPSVNIEGSPDGGATWYQLSNDLIVSGVATAVRVDAPMPGLIRIKALGGSLSDTVVEHCRTIESEVEFDGE